MRSFLILQKRKTGKVIPRIRQKTAKYGDVLDEYCLRVKDTKVWLFTGAHDSGKTRALTRLHQQAEGVFKGRVRPYSGSVVGKRVINHERQRLKTRRCDSDYSWTFPEPLFLSATDPLAKWYDHKGIATWWKDNQELNPEREDYKKLPAHQKADLLSKYLVGTRAVLFIDDVHKITNNSRKGQIIKQCFLAASHSVISASEETRINPSLRVPLMAANPQIVRMQSDASYDITGPALWVLILIAVAAGHWELAMVLGGLKMLPNGLRGTKQT